MRITYAHIFIFWFIKLCLTITTMWHNIYGTTNYCIEIVDTNFSNELILTDLLLHTFHIIVIIILFLLLLYRNQHVMNNTVQHCIHIYISLSISLSLYIYIYLCIPLSLSLSLYLYVIIYYIMLYIHKVYTDTYNIHYLGNISGSNAHGCTRRILSHATAWLAQRAPILSTWVRANHCHRLGN